VRFAHDLGIRLMLSEFSPIPGTPDGERCRYWVDLEEPLCHNKTAFCLSFLGEERVNGLKSLCRELNLSLRLASGVSYDPGEITLRPSTGAKRQANLAL
jgi:hypothetical protein